ncbi:protein phosphatase 2C domain-containing protein [Flavobacterium sp. I-SCBP12n]|uniref:Protein phosphatase 2C domain-containing protein n=1 Tax=Flavobacterium pygoscelis TaxID=2893176 RepID=A0A9X2BM69_9FLAO|nr:PP2C family serine/threonine-protein phosphatase [Flavobacterium pygoscelis]MCK8140710.1 protein phosphatase 2C domain-containing protein [Flavobacterium pygoscelis]
MEETKKYIQSFLSQNKIEIPKSKDSLFDDFINNEKNTIAVKIIKENQQLIMKDWKLKNRIDDIIQQSVFLANGTVNKTYESKIDFIALGWDDIIYYEFKNLEDTGLAFDTKKELLYGEPKISGDIKIKLFFKIDGEAEEVTLNEKTITLIINPDPKSLWKNIESDQNDPFSKEDNVAVSSQFLDKNIVVASKRGRSHANVGSFREDDFAFKNFSTNGWSILAVSDGAGSASLSRKGSKIACDSVVNYFEENLNAENLNQFDEIVLNHYNKTDPESSKKISHFVYNNLSKAAHFVNQKIEEFANINEEELRKFHATLIFALVKKYDFGYAILTFGVGDCPIGLLNKDLTEIKLMNFLDVGEFGGGTRFITMPEIFQSEKFSSRFGFKLVDDFSYLMLMTDGIYDPKFVVEANLERIEKWNEFLSDLKGNNEDGSKVDFEKGNTAIAAQLSNWMDFWSPGNHDDRTLAIIY